MGCSVAAEQSYYAANSASSARSTKSSDFREGVAVEFLYRQDLEDVYWTTWYGREERREGNWRDIYYETSEKGVAHGILRFECFALDNTGDQRVTILDYGVPPQANFDNPTNVRSYTVEPDRRSAWQAEQIEELGGYYPPYELYVIAHYRFCGEGLDEDAE